MRPELLAEITRRLNTDFRFKKQGSEYLREGTCPSCGKRELYAHAEAPWTIRCGRLDKCGHTAHVKEIYPDLFNTWSDRFPQRVEDPNAAADAYLRDARGFRLDRLRGTYTQETYIDRERSLSSGTVRFTLQCGAWWERLIDRPERFGKKKANFGYGQSYAGHWWHLPDTRPAAVPELWLCEGIFDAVALEHHGLPACALLSCNNYPEAELKALAEACTAAGTARPRLVWALDGDNAGRSFMRKGRERAIADGWDCAVALAPTGPGGKKLDWNDLHQRDELDEKRRAEYLFEGRIFTADSAAAKALLLYQRDGGREFPFDFANRTFWWKLDLDKFAKANDALASNTELSDDQRRDRALAESGSVMEIASCKPVPLYYQANELTDEQWYYYRVDFPHKGAPIKAAFTGAQVASASEFKKRLLSIAPGAVFTGSTAQLDRLITKQTFNIKRVTTVDFVGYSREHGVYVFGDLAVKGGQIHELNAEDYFDLPKLAIKTLNLGLGLRINRDRSDYRTDWVEWVWACYGPKGVVALAFWLGSLFAEQIRAEHKSFPFLEVVGDPGSGKSTLIEFLWKLVGRVDYEGFDPSKSTLAARARNFAQVSNLPVVLIEGDRDDAKQKGFDWDELKTAYNGRSVRARGLKNSGNDTYEPPFRGAIVISQNATVQASEPVLQRIVHLHFDRKGHTNATKVLAEQMERAGVENVSGFVLAATRREERVMATVVERTPVHQETLLELPGLKSVRIAKNHAQVMALVEAVAQVLPLSREAVAETLQELRDMALARQSAINADHPQVTEFWELFDYLNERPEARPARTGYRPAGLDDDEPNGGEPLNHARDAQLVAVNLVQFAEAAARQGLRHAPLTELKPLLRTSKSRKFIDIKTVNSRHGGRSVKCWVFSSGQRELA